ncbi:DNA polymerase III subunit beta [Kitasatospora sp. RG8]|uniref:DNA polymerase III subunit beta n=1 Tax=Kitasatospora sp. RG8 TaxID=2820815 RepID=UPI001ADF8438|nr:DNA polymerase III subunit beta [Kitasatospora sp. RG8]MBP0453990.1 DNA polymerase III subunit beta [Kitasatospora sp. RG8]
MKLRLPVSALAEAVSYTAKALPGRAPVPVMLGMLLATCDGGLSLSAADGEVHASATVSAEIADDGTALVPGRLLNDICSRLPKAADVDLELIDQGARLVVGCGAARFTLPVLPVEEYPAVLALPDAVATVQADVLAEAVAQVAIAASTDTALPALTGIKLRLEGELLHLDATDRFRMAHKELTVRPTGTLPAPAKRRGKKDGDDQAAALVPAKSLAEAAKALEGEHTLTLHWSEGLLGLSIPGGRTYMTRLLDGYEFPKMGGFFEGEWPLTLSLPVAEAVAAIQRVALVATRNTPVRLVVEPGGEQLRIEAGSGDDAQASDRIPAHTTGTDTDGAADGLVLAFNPTFLTDALKALGTSEAELRVRHPHKPSYLAGRLGDGIDATYQHLVMPVRLSG